jgi:curved DNA-binding protein CbpA
MNSENPFKILKISPNSDVEEIKQAFRSLIMTSHPDVNPDLHSNAQTKRLIEAYHKALSEAKKKSQPKKNNFDMSLFELQYELFLKKSFALLRQNRIFFII